MGVGYHSTWPIARAQFPTNHQPGATDDSPPARGPQATECRMRKRWPLALLAVAAAAGVVSGAPAVRDILWGYLLGEPFQEGRPLRYWLRTLRAGDPPMRERAAHVLGQLGPASPDVLPALTE